MVSVVFCLEKTGDHNFLPSLKRPFSMDKRKRTMILQPPTSRKRSPRVVTEVTPSRPDPTQESADVVCKDGRPPSSGGPALRVG